MINSRTLSVVIVVSEKASSKSSLHLAETGANANIELQDL